MDEPTVFTTPKHKQPFCLASWSAASVSAVSPLCEIAMNTSSLPNMGRRYLMWYSDGHQWQSEGHQRVIGGIQKHSVAISGHQTLPELGRVLHLDRHASEGLDQILAHEPRVPRSAACNHDEPPGSEDARQVLLDARHLDDAFVGQQAATHAVLEHLIREAIKTSDATQHIQMPFDAIRRIQRHERNPTQLDAIRRN